ncbi:hypothetical protein JCM10207_002803 [Rhodosporidiobolus poonsookiae]
MSDTESRSPHVHDQTVVRLEEANDPYRVDDLEPLTQLWGKPCFEMVQLPPQQPLDPSSKQLDGVESVARGRFSFDADPPCIVRQDYKELWDEMQVHRQRRSKGFCLWGQPGNGKTCALDIFSLICVEREIPFLCYTLGAPAGVLVLVVDGQPRVFSIPRDNFELLEFKVDNFFFVEPGDGDATFGDMATSSAKFLPRTTMVLATSSHPRRFSEWAKQRSALSATIKLVTREEALAVWILKDSPQQSGNLSDHSSAIKFDKLQLKLGKDVPDEGYPADVVEQDMTDPLVEIAPGVKVYTPIFRYHTVGPDLRRIFSEVEPELAPDDSTFMDHILDDVPVDRFLRDAKRLIQQHRSVAHSELCLEYDQIFYLVPSPLNVPVGKRWTPKVRYKTIVPSTFTALRLRDEMAKWDFD